MTDDHAEFSGALVVVIDDEDTQRLLTRDNLEEHGFRIEEASNGEEGLERVRSLRPDLVLLDVMMPGIDGFEVCRRLRADPDICHTPVLLVTGREDTDDIRKGFAAGATDFLTKPVIWNLLPSRVRYVLRTSHLEQELRVAKETAEKASAAKTALLSTMGHELRTPLNAIIGFSGMMRQAALGPIGIPQYEEFSAEIHDAGTRLLDAINAILEIVNCDAGNLALCQTEFDIAGLIDSLAQEFAPIVASAGVQLINNVADDTLCVDGDEQRLRQALSGLMSNAVKFTGRGGVVRLSATQTKTDGLTITISDNGIGIAEEDLPRIMLPFEQVDSSLARNYEGLGLGIPLARAMVRLHGGDIAYESRLGEGTTVRLTLPADRLVLSEKRSPSARTA